MRGAVSTALVAALALAPSWAAAEPRAGVLPLEAQGTLPPNGTRALAAEVEQGMRDAGVTVVPADALVQATVADGASGSGRAPSRKQQKAARAALAACRDAACLRGLASEVSAAYLVRPSVRMEESDYVIALALVDGATGEVVHEAERLCELCGLTEAQAVTRELAASLREPLAAARMGTVTVSSSPAGAEVRVDGEPAGTTPVELRLAPGEHAIVLRRPGYASAERRVVVEARGTAAVALELAPLAPIAGPDDRGRRALLRPLGWASIGVGAAALGSGIALLVLDEDPVAYTRCSGPDVDAQGNCRFRHDTLAGGVVATVVGVVGITAGALLVARARKAGKDGSRRARALPTARGLAIRF